MPEEETLKLVIDWTLPPWEFEEQVGQIIHQYAAAGKVLPLPIALQRNAAGQDLLMVMLSKIDCTGCDATCCREQPANEDKIFMDPLEYEDLKRKYPAIMRGLQLDRDNITAPCPLLKEGRCQVYHDRPFVCWLYPFQFGAWVGREHGSGIEGAAALSSSCPGARKLAKSIYLTRYQMRRNLQRLGHVPKD